MNLDDTYAGVFLPRAGEFAGHLNIAGAKSSLQLIGTSFPNSVGYGYLDIHGTLTGGKKASLLGCVWQGRTEHHLEDGRQFESTFFPNYVVVGNEFIGSTEPVIRAVRYHFEKVSSLVSGHKTFQSLHLDRDEVSQLLKSDFVRSEEISKQHGWPAQPFEPEIGDHPHLLYFSGVWEIVSSETKLGRVSLTNRSSHTMGSAKGIGIQNQVTANIEFAEPTTLTMAIRALTTLHSLFELSLGGRQRYDWIELELTHRRKDRDVHQSAKLFWSLCNERVEGDTKTTRMDILLSPDRRPDEFVKVAAGWMNSTEDLGDPRNRFATAFFGSYGINRIVGAANMFDLLPENYAPKKIEPEAQLKAVVAECRAKFATLPDSFAKQSVLSSLGRVGTASLRDKVYHRAERIVSIAGQYFPDINLPCSQAVLARNHYVHGSRASFDYHDHFSEFAFLTDTLEFVFAASDLVDLGWDLVGWIEAGGSMTHGFSSYVINYSENMQRLKALVGK